MVEIEHNQIPSSSSRAHTCAGARSQYSGDSKHRQYFGGFCIGEGVDRFWTRPARAVHLAGRPVTGGSWHAQQGARFAGARDRSEFGHEVVHHVGGLFPGVRALGQQLQEPRVLFP